MRSTHFAIACAGLTAVLAVAGAAAQDSTKRGAVDAATANQAVARLDAEALLVRGLTQARLGKLEPALATLTQALERAPDEGSIASALSGVYSRLGDFVSAEFYARRAYELEPRPEFGLELSAVLSAAGQGEAASEVLEQLRTRFPESSIVQAAVVDPAIGAAVVPAVVLSDDDRDDENGASAGSMVEHSLEELQAKHADDPDDSSIAFVLAQRLLEEGRAAAALPLFEDLVSIDVRNESAWVGLAAARFESGAAGPATSTAIEGLLFFPGSTELVIIAARATAAVGDGDDGRTLLARLQNLATEKDPQQAADLLAHGALLARSVDAQSTDFAVQAIALDPGNRLALALLAARVAADGDDDGAREYLGRMQLPGARDWEAAEAAAHAFLALGDRNLSGQMFVLAASGPYASQSVLLEAARAHVDRGDEGAANELLSRAKADSTTDAVPRNGNEHK